MRRQTAQRSRFQQLDRRTWNLRRCRNVTNRERFFFSRAAEAVSKVLVVHGVGTLQSSSPRRVFFNVFGQLLPKSRSEPNRARRALSIEISYPGTWRSASKCRFLYAIPRVPPDPTHTCAAAG